MFGLLGLLTRIRISKTPVDLQAASKRQYLFPAAGAVIGIMVAIVALACFTYLDKIFDSLVISLLVVLFLYFVTGLLHLEGLADFGDGLMTSGDSMRKRGAMKDVSLGASGTFFMIIAVLSLILFVRNLGGWTDAPVLFVWAGRMPLVIGLVVAEIAAKLSMNTVMAVGPSSHEGMGSIFVQSATPARFISAFALAIILGVAISGIFGLIVLIGPIVGFAVALIARRHFGGVGGDSFGAANEAARIIALLTWVVVV